jgi:TatD DNase family protein
MVYSDSHAHLDSYPPEELAVVLDQMKAKKVNLVLNVSINLAASEEAILLAQSHDEVLAAIGIHPGEAVPLTESLRKYLYELSGQQRVVAFGEIGLDYGRPTADREMQQELLIYQLSLARNAHLPVDIHYSMNAHQDIMEILRREKRAGLSGMVHGFLGNLKELHDWLDLDFYISLGQSSLGLWKDLQNMVPPLTNEVVCAVPSERLITETDAMARMSVSRWKVIGGPPPGTDPSTGIPAQEEFRQPADVVAVVQKIAAIRGDTAENIGNITTANLRCVLQL